MIIANTNISSEGYGTHFVMTYMDDETLQRAKMIFAEYKDKGVILNSNFEDNIWLLTSQVKRCRLHFGIDEIAYLRNAQDWLCCTPSCFSNCIKAYVIFQLGYIGLNSLQTVMKRLLEIAEIPHNKILPREHTIEFLKLLPSGHQSRDFIIEKLEEQMLFRSYAKGNKHQRILVDFDNYFKFNDILEQFWESADKREKLFYFPLFLWWKLTAILPLRPTEFLMTPRKCLDRKNGEIILTIRRTKLKGGNHHLHYNLNDDYQIINYSIPEKLADEIRLYLDATAEMPISHLETLFVLQPYEDFTLRSSSINDSYFAYYHLSNCLRRFQISKMGLDLQGDGCIRLGDTRHLAMINLIVSGGSPSICKELAGHEDIAISSHYYANISQFIECATYEFYRKQHNHSVGLHHHKLSVADETTSVEGGTCDSQAYLNGSISDCIRHMGSNGELGQCVSCQHFIDGKTGYYLAFNNVEQKQKRVDDDCKYLLHVLETVRKGIGYKEDIQSAILKLQCSSTKYSQCLYKNMEEIEHGQTKKNDK